MACPSCDKVLCEIHNEDHSCKPQNIDSELESMDFPDKEGNDR